MFFSLVFITVVSLLFLTLYAASVVAMLLRQPKRSVPAPLSTPAIAVLIPAKNEGKGLADCVESVLRQDYSGTVEIYVLVKDPHDDALPFLPKNVHVLFSGRDDKAYKLDSAILWLPEHVERIAFLDADHRADPSWLRLLSAALDHTDAVGVQGRRRPLSVKGIARLWDAVESHIGNEAYNNALGEDVAFTGTSALFKRETFDGPRFGQNGSITEDTDFTWQLWVQGRRVDYCSSAVTAEEAAPDLASYVARRRRWAAGHTRAFLRHFEGRSSVRTWMYGAFYFTALASFAAFAAEALFIALQLQPWQQLTSVALSLAVAVALTRRGALLGALVLWPVALEAVHFADAGSESFYAVISFPLARLFTPWRIMLLLVPLVVLFDPRRRVLTWQERVLVALTYPAWLLFFVYAALSGLASRGREWSQARRDPILGGRLPLTRIALGILAVVLLAFSLNEALAKDACGELVPFLWKPSLRTPRNLPQIELLAHRDGDDVSIAWSVRAPGAWSATLYEGDKPLLSHSGSGDASRIERTPAPRDWLRHDYYLDIEFGDFRCQRDVTLSGADKRFVGKDLVINGEPFLIKGIVPSFAAAPLSLPVDVGFAQIKAAGANAVRLYHAPSNEVLRAARQNDLLLIVQPDRSTWNEVDMSGYRIDPLGGLGLRFSAVAERLQSDPHVLFLLAGNEIELSLDAPPLVKMSAGLTRMMRDAPLLTGYATYLTSGLDHPGVRAINMLDTGSVYWRDVLPILGADPRPYFASELGGFVAFHEQLPAQLRIERLQAQWSALLQQRALGAVIYESHDNWAQPLPPGYDNDPFSPEQPDDTRGLWTRDNVPKPELAFVSAMFSDLDASLTNRRRYTLHDTKARCGEETFSLGTLLPGERAELMLPAGPCTITATTHGGLRQTSSIRIPPRLPVHKPTVVNADWIAKDDHHGSLVDSRSLEILVPDGVTSLTVNGRKYAAHDHRVTVALPAPRRDVTHLEMSLDSRPFEPFDGTRIGKQAVQLRFDVPWVGGTHRLLVLEGLGADEATVAMPALGAATLPTFPYREMLVDLGPHGPRATGSATVTVRRTSIRYDMKEAASLPIELKAPVLYAPVEIEY